MAIVSAAQSTLAGLTDVRISAGRALRLALKSPVTVVAEQTPITFHAVTDALDAAGFERTPNASVSPAYWPESDSSVIAYDANGDRHYIGIDAGSWYADGQPLVDLDTLAMVAREWTVKS